jgi:subtilisin family serine protease
MKNPILFTILFAIFHTANGQFEESKYKDGEIWVILNSEAINKTQDHMISIKDPKIQSILNTYSADDLKMVFPYSRSENLKNVYKIKFKGKTSNLVAELDSIDSNYLQNIIKIPKTKKIVLYDPSDYIWSVHPEWLWHISNIRADEAWDITHGDSDIKIAILDNWFDINHPDLSDKIFPAYDPYDTTYWGTNCMEIHMDHGTGVASFVAAETDGGGQLASVGFNCKIIGYQAHDGDYLERAHDASLRMGADVLTSSAGGWSCEPPSLAMQAIQRQAVEEIIANGTVIVMPAGNGPTNQCIPLGEPDAQPWYPLHPDYDDDIIIVTSIGSDNNHFYENNNRTHSNYPEVDICSPGYELMGARQIEMDTCDPGLCCVDNSWPYGGWFTGTSFATPIVAGVVGLMKSVNPSLTQSDVADIIEETADPVLDENS